MVLRNVTLLPRPPSFRDPRTEGKSVPHTLLLSSPSSHDGERSLLPLPLPVTALFTTPVPLSVHKAARKPLSFPLARDRLVAPASHHGSSCPVSPEDTGPPSGTAEVWERRLHLPGGREASSSVHLCSYQLPFCTYTCTAPHSGLAHSHACTHSPGGYGLLTEGQVGTDFAHRSLPSSPGS